MNDCSNDDIDNILCALKKELVLACFGFDAVDNVDGLVNAIKRFDPSFDLDEYLSSAIEVVDGEAIRARR